MPCTAKSTMEVVPPNAAAIVPVSKSSEANVPPNGSSMCVCTSIPPGMTYFPFASIRFAPPAFRSAPTAAIFSSITSTSALNVSAAVTTVPPVMSVFGIAPLRARTLLPRLDIAPARCGLTPVPPIDPHVLHLVIRWAHVAAMAIALGGALLVAVIVFTRRDSAGALAAALAYERLFWAAAGVLVMTGVGNLGAFGRTLPEPRTEWGSAVTVKLAGVAVLLLTPVPQIGRAH